MTISLQDPMFFYAIAFVACLSLAYWLGRQPALQWLDGEIAKIKAELDAAHQLHADAEAALVDCKEKKLQAERDAQMIVDMARQQVEVMRKKAEDDLAITLARHQQQSSERIRIASEEAIADVRAAVISAGIDIARKTLSDNLLEVDAMRLIDQVVVEIPSLKPAKPKAA